MKEQKKSWGSYWWYYYECIHNYIGERTLHRIYPKFMSGRFICSGFNYKIELLDKDIKKKLAITSSINYFNEKEQAILGVALNSWETAYFKETAFYVNGTFDKIKKDLSIVMTEFIIKKTQKDWQDMENNEMNNEKFASEEEFKDYWKRTDTLEDYGVIVQKVSKDVKEIYDKIDCAGY